jgi:hypothetical protein
VALPDTPVIAAIASEQLIMALIFNADIQTIASHESGKRTDEGTIPAFVLVESCYVADCGWSYAQCTPQGRERLRAALLPYRKNDIPTVYWLTRDVIHYENFRACMADFDLVCVADPRALDLVTRDYPDKQIIFLPPAVSPQMHNPFRWGGDEPRILFDGWGELQERPERYNHLAALPQDSIDIVESRYILHKTKLRSLPDVLKKRLRGCLTHAQLAWAARHYSVALEDSESFSTPLARLQKRLEYLSCGLAMTSNWNPEPDLSALLPADAPISICGTAEAASAAALEMLEQSTEQMRSRIHYLGRLWHQCGMPQRLSAIARALGQQGVEAARLCSAIFDGSKFDEAEQASLADIFRSWKLGTLYASDTIPAMQNVAEKAISHPLHFGSFWEASSSPGIDTVLISQEQRPKEDWLGQLRAIKEIARADVAVLTSSADNSSNAALAEYIDAEALQHAGDRIRPVAMLVASDKLPRRPGSSDLKVVLFEICKSRQATVAVASEGLFGGSALR